VKRWGEQKILDKMNLNLSVRLPKDIGRQAGKIYGKIEAFAEYAFNKSHSACCAWIAYQTNLNMYGIVNMKQVSFFMEECKQWDKTMSRPWEFTVNDNYAVRFGMGTIKGWEQEQ
jgi:DNA polymerase III alpha subunit